MVIIKTSHINACNYWFAHNSSLGQAAGITEELAADIGTDQYLDSESFSNREKMAILWAEHVTLNTAKNNNGVFERVRKEFSEEEIIELTLMSGYFNFFNRFMDSLRIPLESQEEIDKIKRSVHLDPAQVRTYLEKLVSAWPTNIPGPNPDWIRIDKIWIFFFQFCFRANILAARDASFSNEAAIFDNFSHSIWSS